MTDTTLKTHHKEKIGTLWLSKADNNLEKQIENKKGEKQSVGDSKIERDVILLGKGTVTHKKGKKPIPYRYFLY